MEKNNRDEAASDKWQVTIAARQSGHGAKIHRKPGRIFRNEENL
jgi:hypothetical protein